MASGQRMNQDAMKLHRESQVEVQDRKRVASLQATRVEKRKRGSCLKQRERKRRCVQHAQIGLILPTQDTALVPSHHSDLQASAPERTTDDEEDEDESEDAEEQEEEGESSSASEESGEEREENEDPAERIWPSQVRKCVQEVHLANPHLSEDTALNGGIHSYLNYVKQHLQYQLGICPSDISPAQVRFDAAYCDASKEEDKPDIVTAREIPWQQIWRRVGVPGPSPKYRSTCQQVIKDFCADLQPHLYDMLK